MKKKLWQWYDATTLNQSVLMLLGITIVVAYLVSFVPRFKPDASADSLVLENDDDLRYHREIVSKYGSNDFLIVTYAPVQGLFTPASIKKLKSLQDDLMAVNGVERIVSILNVPLLNSPRIQLTDLSKTPRTIETSNVDLQLAKREFLESPLYKQLLLGKDGKTTALLAYLERDLRYEELLAERERLRQLKYNDQLNEKQSHKLEQAEKAYSNYQAEHTKRSREQIAKIKAVIDQHRADAEMFLGGVPMIVADMLSFIQSDFLNFGVAVTVFLILTLLIIFRQPRWIIIPMLCAGLVAVSMIGIMGLLNWPVTVISANFVALLLIITMSMTIHLVVRYRELQAQQADADKKDLIRQTMHFMFKPCVYTSLTTIVAFISLFVSGIRPVIDFGHIMTLGIVFSFLLVFILFPAILMNLPKDSNLTSNDFTTALTISLARFTHKHHHLILFIAVVVAIGAMLGITQLKVENRFIDYFKKETEIYRGMLTIDDNLGGTTPFDLIVNAPPEDTIESEKPDREDELLDSLDDLLADEGIVESPTEYWLTSHKLKEVKRLHDYLDAQPEIGKVLSLATLIRLVEQLNNNQDLGDVEIGLLRKILPPEIKNILLNPYLSEDGKQLRFNTRIIDSDKNLNRQQLLERIQNDLNNEMNYAKDRFRLTGMLVLYNNMLQSLYKSQILTIGMVFFMIMLMFIILFRSLSLAIIAIIPNLLAASLVLGFMGWRGIPLDIMTITIAAISIGIAVDNTIHYIIRFKREFVCDQHYANTVQRCHRSIGKAMYYTSITIIAGLSILSLSNFIPTVYFGLLASLAMFVALVASLTLLPSLLIIFKPLGKGTSTA